MATFWTIVEENTGIRVSKHLKNILMLNGYDDALSIQSITTKDIDLFEQFVKNEMKNYIGVNDNPKDFYGHIFYDKRDKFKIMKGDRVKLMDVVEFVKTKLASESGAYFYNQSEEDILPTSSKLLYSQELPMDLIEDHVDINQPIQIEPDVPETAHDNDFIAELRATKRNRDTSFPLEDDLNDKGPAESNATKRNRSMDFSREDNSHDEGLIVPLKISTSSQLKPILSSVKAIKNDIKNVVDSTKDNEIRRRVQSLDRTKICSEVMLNAKHDSELTQCRDIQITTQSNHSYISVDNMELTSEVNNSKQTENTDQKRKDLTDTTMPSTRPKSAKDPLTIVSSPSSNDEISNSTDSTGTHNLQTLTIAGKEISPSSMPIVQEPEPDDYLESNNNEMQKKKKVDTEGFCCEICEKMYSSEFSLKRHIMTIHTGNKQHVCKVCDRKFSRINYLRRHLRIHTGEKLHDCDICHKSFNNPSHLTRHKGIHTGEKLHNCDICHKSCNDPSNLRTHKRSHTGEKLHVCDVCDKAFARSSDLLQHKMIHSGEKPHDCDICHKAFNNPSNLTRHKTIHTGEKLHYCDICHKAFNNPSNLTRHKRIHTGEKPHVCDVCDKAFTRSSNLLQHMMIHSGEKLHDCDICHKSFNDPSNLRTHKRIHTGEKPHVCDVCDRAFTRSSYLLQHKMIHANATKTGEQRHDCDICPKTFKNPSNLMKHKRNHSGEK